MEYYARIDVSLEQSSVCVVDGTGKIVREAKVASESEALVHFFGQLNVRVWAEGQAVVAVAACGAGRGQF